MSNDFELHGRLLLAAVVGVSREEFVLATVPGFDVQRWEH